MKLTSPMRRRRQVLLSLSAIATVALGLWLAAVQLKALVYEAQGKCDFMPCTSSSTVPELIAGAVVVLIGTTAGAFLIRVGGATDRKTSEQTDPKGLHQKEAGQVRDLHFRRTGRGRG